MEILQQDSGELLDPLFNIDKIGERPIMNVEVDREESFEMNHRVRHVIKMMQDWIKKPFKLDPIPEIVIFHPQAHLVKGRGKKVTIPIFLAQSLIRPEMVYQIDRQVGYYHTQEIKSKGKRKRNSPLWTELEEGEISTPPQQEKENVQGPEDTWSSQE